MFCGNLHTEIMQKETLFLEDSKEINFISSPCVVYKILCAELVVNVLSFAFVGDKSAFVITKCTRSLKKQLAMNYPSKSLNVLGNSMCQVKMEMEQHSIFI